ncbi:MAG: hypothetical protein JSU09_00715 [Bacteroidetes bacterium]|nr:hypothetical protein [Bacteroidota bacterium]
MRKLKRLLLTFISISTIISCAWFEQNENEKIVGSYSISQIDSQGTNVTKGVKEGGGSYTVVINPDVYSVGHSGKFIFAKQRERFSYDGVTNYYIVDTIKNVNDNKGVYGPLSKIKFDSLVTRFKIPKVVFDMNYPKK